MRPLWKRGGLFISQVPNPPLPACSTQQQQWVRTSRAHLIRISPPIIPHHLAFVPYPQNPQGQRGGRLGGLLRSLVSPMTSNKKKKKKKKKRTRLGDESGACSLTGGRRSGGGKTARLLLLKPPNRREERATSRRRFWGGLEGRFWAKRRRKRLRVGPGRIEAHSKRSAGRSDAPTEPRKEGGAPVRKGATSRRERCPGVGFSVLNRNVVDGEDAEGCWRGENRETTRPSPLISS